MKALLELPRENVLQPADTSRRGCQPTLCYILAASHSGSTLLAMLLGAQEGICTTGELRGLPTDDTTPYRCSCGEHIQECGFWEAVRTEMIDRGVEDFQVRRARVNHFAVESRYASKLVRPLYRGRLLEVARDAALNLSPTWRTHLRETQRRNRALLESVAAVSGASIVVDSSKHATRLKYLRQIPGLDIKVIRLVRDGRAVALTYMDEWKYADASNESLRGGGFEARSYPRRTMAEAAKLWKRSNESADLLTKDLPAASWTHLSYEQLCADPENTTRQLRRFLDLEDIADINLDFRSKTQHVIGNGMRLDATSQIRLDERWRESLSDADLAEFDRTAGDLNASYGCK